MSDTLLFVYGTLRSGHEANLQMAGAQRLGPARTKPRYGLSAHQGDRALTSTGNQAIEGELYVVPGDILGQVDEWERRHFLRKEVSLEDGRTAEAYFLRESRTKEYILASRSRIHSQR